MVLRYCKSFAMKTSLNEIHESLAQRIFPCSRYMVDTEGPSIYNLWKDQWHTQVLQWKRGNDITIQGSAFYMCSCMQSVFNI